jgi:hypothetical protein
LVELCRFYLAEATFILTQTPEHQPKEIPMLAVRKSAERGHAHHCKPGSSRMLAGGRPGQAAGVAAGRRGCSGGRLESAVDIEALEARIISVDLP